MAKNNTTKYRSNLQEKDVAKQVGGKQVIASGSLWFASSDCRSEYLLIECKTTKNPYYSLSHQVWDKICNEALKDGMRVPVMCIELNNRTYKDRLAVFQTGMFGDLFPTEPYAMVNSTVRVTSPCNLRFQKGKQKDKSVTVMDWKDFVRIAETYNYI